MFAQSDDEDMGDDGQDADMAMVQSAQFDVKVLSLVEQLGGSSRGYRRDRKRQLRALVSEIYSRPRVTNAAKLLPSLRAMPGYASDLTTADENGIPWEFDVKERRDEAMRRIREQKPVLLIGSPMCTAFSAWQHLNNAKKDPEDVLKEYAKAMVHMQFSCELYKMQADEGRYFLHEQPDKATSWK